MMNQLTDGNVKAKELVNWLEFSKTGCPLLYLGLTILLNWMICIAVDCAINYPMSRARMLTSVRKFVVSLVRPVRRIVYRLCSFFLCCMRSRNRNDQPSLRTELPAGTPRKAGKRAMQANDDLRIFRRRNASRNLGLNVQVSSQTRSNTLAILAWFVASLLRRKLRLICICISSYSDFCPFRRW